MSHGPLGVLVGMLRGGVAREGGDVMLRGGAVRLYVIQEGMGGVLLIVHRSSLIVHQSS